MPHRLTLLALLAVPLLGCGPYRTIDFYDEISGETQKCAVNAKGQPVQCRDGFLNRDALANRPTSYRDLPPSAQRK